MKKYEVAVVGGGIAGMSTAYRLARRGIETVLFEKSTLGFEASSRNAGGVRHMFRDPKEIPLARFSIDVWAGISEELGHDVEYRRNGCIRLALEDNHVEPLRAAFEKDQASGLPVELLEPAEIDNIIPIDKGKALLASYCSMDGHANPVETCRGFAAAAARAGVELHEGTTVDRIQNSDSGFTIETSAGSFQASKLLLAAGPWTANLLTQFGINLRFQLRRPEMAETEVVAPFLKPFVGLGDLQGYGRQTVAGNMHMGIRNLDADLSAPESQHELIRAATRLWGELFPQLRGVKVKRTWSGFTSRSPDECAILGDIPTVDGLYIAAGFSGHGFALGPGVGIVMAETMAGDTPSADISRLHITRFN